MTTTQCAITLLFSTFGILVIVKLPIPFALIISTTATVHYLKIPLVTVGQQMANAVNTFNLLAVPFFILAGEIMGAGGISNRIVNFANVLVGRWRGGLAQVNVLGSMMFGGISGSAVADVSSIGAMLIPLMKKTGYDEGFSVALTVTTACQGVLIPPSHNMIFYAMSAGTVSVGKLFLAGVTPGVMLGLGFMVYVGVVAVLRDFPKGDAKSFRESLRITKDAFLALFTAFIILGGVTLGFFTATESAAIACLYALFISFFVYRDLKLAQIPKILSNVVRTLTITYSLIATAGAFGWINAYMQVPKLIATSMMSISSNPYAIIGMILVMLLFLGCIMDMAPLIFICTPILLPVAKSIKMDPVHFGIVMIFSLAVGLCTPPVGSALFVGCAVGKVTIERAVKAMLPMYFVMIFVLVLISYFPILSMWLPRMMGIR